MAWQVEGDGWLLLNSRPLRKGGWHSRIRRYDLTDENLQTGKIMLKFDSILPTWSYAGTLNKIFLGFGAAPLQKEQLERNCDSEAIIVGSISEFLRTN